MTDTQKKLGTDILNDMEKGLMDLIKDNPDDMGDLLNFSKNLTKDKQEKPLTEQNLQQLKSDLKNGGLIDFQGGEIDGERFWFEVIGNDIKPTLTPQGDAIIPINFRYDGQRRTKLLILHIKDHDGMNIYEIPWWENKYELEIKKKRFIYQLIYDIKGFHMILCD